VYTGTEVIYYRIIVIFPMETCGMQLFAVGSDLLLQRSTNRLFYTNNFFISNGANLTSINDKCNREKTANRRTTYFMFLAFQ